MKGGPGRGAAIVLSGLSATASPMITLSDPMQVRYQVRLSSENTISSTHLAVRHVDGLYSVRKTAEIKDMQDAFPKSRDIGFAYIPVVKDVVGYQVWREAGCP